MNSDLLAKDIMITNPLTLSEDMTIPTAIDLLTEQSVQSAPVVNDNGLLVGFLSVHDVMVDLWCQDYLPEGEQKVADLMKPSVITLDVNEPLVNIVEQLCIDKGQLYPISSMGIATKSMATALSLEDRAKNMRVNTPKVLPVLMSGALVGIITRIEVMKALRLIYGEKNDIADQAVELKLA